MNDLLIQPFQLAWATGALSHGPLIRKTTLLGDLSAIFTDGDATQLFPIGLHMLSTCLIPPAARESFTSASHIFIPVKSVTNIL